MLQDPLADAMRLQDHLIAFGPAYSGRPGDPLGDPLEALDAAHEDAQGRLPHEAGYGQRGDVLDLFAKTTRRRNERKRAA